MITADQIYLHLIGDYILQSDWQAINKTKRWFPALVHALVYSLGFLCFRPSLTAWLVILVTHFFIDRYRLARYVVWAKNFIAPPNSNPPWAECSGTGYPKDRPDWLTVWLGIIADNCIHIGINALALRYPSC